MINLVSRSEWQDEPVRAEAVVYALEAIAARGEKIEISIIDHTGFLKHGKYSPGVHRQCTGSAGKTANCQVAESLTVASRSTHVPVDMELFVPQAWTDDRARCRAAKIPDDVGNRPKWQIALLMLERAKSMASRLASQWPIAPMAMSGSSERAWCGLARRMRSVSIRPRAAPCSGSAVASATPSRSATLPQHCPRRHSTK
jgi:SRSO17 transposase